VPLTQSFIGNSQRKILPGRLLRKRGFVLTVRAAGRSQVLADYWWNTSAFHLEALSIGLFTTLMAPCHTQKEVIFLKSKL
jgi:hypothetical protein